MDKQKTDPAFPCLPMNDNFGRMIVPVPGMSKYEIVLKDFICVLMQRPYDSELTVINAAQDMTEAYFKHLNNNNESESTKPVFTIQ